MYKVRWIGWNFEKDSKNNTKHDKIWGWIETNDGRYFCFYGARGMTVQVLEHPDYFTITKKAREKERKGYKTVNSNTYDPILGTDFFSNMESQLMTAILIDKEKAKGR